MRSCQPTLSKPRDREVLSLYLKNKSTQGVPSWRKEQKYCSIRQRYKGHWQGRQRSSPTSENLHVSEGSTPKPLGSKRTSSTSHSMRSNIVLLLKSLFPCGIQCTYNAMYCLRSLYAYSQAGSILHIMQSTS